MGSQDARRDGPVETEPLQQGRPRSKIVGGRFVIDRLIARGGMGAVYLAHQLNLGRPVALKIMTPPPDSEDGDTFEERFRLEAETLAALHHPNIVTVYDYGPTEDGRYYLALEYVEGPRFTDLIRKGRMAPERAVRLMLQVCNALRYAHKRGVVHRDLKPSNLLVRVEDGVEGVKVVDFGLVKVAEADQSLTRAGLVLGSPHCMAPEQVRGEEIDQRADLYAIGILLFRSLTGHWPFHGETVAATMIAHVHEERPTFHSVAPDLMVPDGLEEVTQRLMSRDPADRYADAGELIDALAACLDIPEDQFLTVSSYHGGLATASRGVDQDDDRRRWVPPLVVALLLLMIIAVLGLWRPWAGGTVDTTPPASAQAPAGDAPAALASEALTGPSAAPGHDAAPPSAADGPPPVDAASTASGGDQDAPRADASGAAASGADAAPAPAGSDRPKPSTSAGTTRPPEPADQPAAASRPTTATSPEEGGDQPSPDGSAPPAEGEKSTPAGYMPLPDDF